MRAAGATRLILSAGIFMAVRAQGPRMSRVLVLGNATLDVIQRVDRLPMPGETVLALSTARCAGGKGLNQAVAASRTGAPTLLAAPIGQDAEAAFLADGFRDEAGLDVNWLICNAPTDLSAIWVATGENVIVAKHRLRALGHIGSSA